MLCSDIKLKKKNTKALYKTGWEVERKLFLCLRGHSSFLHANEKCSRKKKGKG